MNNAKKIMGYKQPSYTWQTLFVIKHSIDAWLTWQDAKHWAKVMHPGWVRFATQRNRPEIRETYKKKILDAYRKECMVANRLL